jgi:hypothetical protein
MADSVKRVNCVKVCFTDREYIDLGRAAAREDRKVADMVWFLVRRSMYGIVAAEGQQEQGTDED